MPILIIAIIIIFCGIVSLCTGQVEDWIYENNVFLHSAWDLTVKYFYLFAGVGFLGLAWIVYIYFKPHPAEKYFLAYKDKRITRSQSISSIADTMYSYRRDKLPSSRKSKAYLRRIKWLNKRINAEKEFMDDLISYMRSQNRII